jgi:carbamoyltransferase
VQTVDHGVDPRFHALLAEFGRITGYPILLNTSFNMRGEPIVCDPSDALICFVRAKLDALVIGDLLLMREHIPQRWESLVDNITPILDRAISGDFYSFM